MQSLANKMAIEIIETTGINNSNLVNEEISTNYSNAIRALKRGYAPFAPHTEEYPYLGHLYRDQTGSLGLIIMDQQGRKIIEPISRVLNVGLFRQERQKLEEAKATGLFDAFMVAASCDGPFERRKPYRSQRLALIAYASTKEQPLRFGQDTYRAVPPRFIALNGMGFLIST